MDIAQPLLMNYFSLNAHFQSWKSEKVEKLFDGNLITRRIELLEELSGSGFVEVEEKWKILKLYCRYFAWIQRTDANKTGEELSYVREQIKVTLHRSAIHLLGSYTNFCSQIKIRVSPFSSGWFALGNVAAVWTGLNLLIMTLMRSKENKPELSSSIILNICRACLTINRFSSLS